MPKLLYGLFMLGVIFTGEASAGGSKGCEAAPDVYFSSDKPLRLVPSNEGLFLQLHHGGLELSVEVAQPNANHTAGTRLNRIGYDWIAVPVARETRLTPRLQGKKRTVRATPWLCAQAHRVPFQKMSEAAVDFANERFNEVVTKASDAAEGFARLGYIEHAAWAWITASRANYWAERFSDAVDNLEQASRLNQEQSSEPITSAIALMHHELRLENEVEYYSESNLSGLNDLLSALKQQKRLFEYAYGLNLLGLIHRKLGNFNHAVNSFTTALGAFEDIDDEYFELVAKQNRALINLYQRHDVEASVADYRDIVARLDPERWGYQDAFISIQSNRALGHRLLAQHGSAIEIYNSLVQRFPDYSRIGRLYSGLGTALLNAGDLEGAEATLKLSVQELTQEKDKQFLSSSLRQLALIFSMQNRLEEASETLQKSAALATTKRTRLEAMLDIALIWCRLGHTQNALSLLKTELDSELLDIPSISAKRYFVQASVEQEWRLKKPIFYAALKSALSAADPNLLNTVVSHFADNLVREGEVAEAVRVLDRAWNTLDNLRAEITKPELRVFFLTGAA